MLAEMSMTLVQARLVNFCEQKKRTSFNTFLISESTVRAALHRLAENGQLPLHAQSFAIVEMSSRVSLRGSYTGHSRGTDRSEELRTDLVSSVFPFIRGRERD